MNYHFTPGAERALTYACSWSSRNGCDELEVQELLLGLLAEPECRAAMMLSRAAIDVQAVRQRWPEITEKISRPDGGVRQFSVDVELSLRNAVARSTAFPRPVELATEHLLLGLAAADHEVSTWLRQKGLDPDALEAEICKLHGYPYRTVEFQNEDYLPLPVEMEDRKEEATSRSAADPGAIAAEPAGKESVAASPRTDEASRAAATAEGVAVLRVLDAAANRAREGLRVVEDYVRFVLDDRHLTELCKQLRHDLTDALGRISPPQRLAARETQADIGTQLSTAAEQSRGQAAAVLAANFARLQESLRSLEEYAKLGDADLSATFKQLRYRAYTLQRSVELTRGNVERLAASRLYVLIDGRSSAAEFERLAGELIAAGTHLLQLRDKRLGDRELLDRARRLRRLTRGAATLFVMNDRPDVAALAQADGVHLGQEDVSVKDARSIVGPEALVGVSTHGIEQARQAVLDGASYIGVGPTFPSVTKQFSHYPGAELLRAVAAEIRLPAFAIGGICRENVAAVLETGFTRIAVSSAVVEAADPMGAVRELLDALASRSV